MTIKIRFDEIEAVVPETPGIYEIHTDTGIALKVGIASNLRKRLLRHRASRQSGLRLKAGGNRGNPDDIRSNGSILAKHLYHDNTIATPLNMTLESERRRFLGEMCYVLVEATLSKQEARVLEKEREALGKFRYVGKVLNR